MNNYLNKKQLIILLLGFSSGLQLALTGGTLQAWLKDSKVDLSVIGYLSAVSVPYTYKFLWAPALDTVQVSSLGIRRGWILLTQFLLIASIVYLGSLNPESELSLVATIALAVAFFSATQDIAIDAFRREILLDSELGQGAATSQLGYRLGMILSSGIALILADKFGWHVVYYSMAASLLVGVGATLISEEPARGKRVSPKLADFVLPFKDFFKRSFWPEILLLILLYKITDAFAMALTTPFLIELGFTKTEIGSVLKIIGVSATILGSLLAGWLMTKLSLRSALIYFGMAQLLANFAYFALSLVGPSFEVFTISVIIENFGSGLGTAAFVAFLMTITSREFSATQYSLYTSIAALSRLLVQIPSGDIAKSLGWSGYFLLSVALGIPAVLLVTVRFNRWKLSKDPVSL